MKTKLKIPTSWADVTIGQFQEYTTKQAESTTTEDRVRVTLEILCDISPEVINSLSAKDMMRVMQLIQFVESEPDGNVELQQKFKMEDIELGFIPNWRNLTLGEYVDLETYCVGHDMVSNLHKAMALMYRPITYKSMHQYEIAPYEPNVIVQEAMKQVPMQVAVSAMVFFYNIGKRFATDMQSYLSQQKENTSPILSKLNGDGTGLSMN